ncbi:MULTISPECIES: MotA/TolQ/ExbB proton channel family protein [Neisseria]|uniref:Biopolymer transport protein ExbB n=1 Tax=Neisseria animaloris TaxID=326522 RepID=A0A1X3CP03_9NEIS|nr:MULTISPECIES: MotA/TolQ/ExbB proton channel family protein [Neisseria]MDO1510466.1 MotA/TolQ/ExbB proton channel family protein [Neisseria sp. MVDL19-042950]MDO1516635.1 MotA/TolQ/ExbB proton channel family protein [Neisseria sp. MVDL18-041461]MDO1563781.1 MotA/TolQ/ExbB proton channel family protein [Neisseria sp. MVDL20-010259]MDO5072796.1 MotA/TolQ/ExbB proton channel family protein [Neisseria animaloris]OSI08927.1 biopolymer transporter ExbB [Neisseria animaloris]
MNLGLVFESGDYVLIGVFLTLVLMSIVTWTVIVVRAVKLSKAKKGNRTVKPMIWDAKSLDEAVQKAKKVDSPMSDLTLEAVRAHQNYNRHKDTQIAAAVPLNEYLVRQIRNSMSQILRRFDGGLTALASIGATAPFIGLFGTVWGIYHALINISQSGQMSIAAVAGPIGEALVATAAGLFVAIPAVLAYNFLVRGNKTLAQDMDAFAHDFHVQLLNNKD